MKKLLFDFFPILLFFVAYKVGGLYIATGVAIAASFLQVAIYWYQHHSFEKMHIITLVLITILGGATLFLHNEIFIKWKPTAINWIFALLFAGSQYFGEKPFIKHLLEMNLDLPDTVWQRLNMSWVAFFSILGAINLYIVYHFSTDAWVNFKLFGMLGLTLFFVVAQSFYLAKYCDPENKSLKS